MEGTGPVAEKGLRGVVAKAFSLTEDLVYAGMGLLLAFSAAALLVTGAAELWRNFLNAWEGYRSEAEEYRELDDERVLVLLCRSGRGKRSGIQIASEGAVLYHIRSGRVTRQVMYWDRERAFADLGLQG